MHAACLCRTCGQSANAVAWTPSAPSAKSSDDRVVCAACSIQHAAGNTQHTTRNHTTRSIHRTAYSMQHTSRMLHVHVHAAFRARALGWTCPHDSEIPRGTVSHAGGAVSHAGGAVSHAGGAVSHATRYPRHAARQVSADRVARDTVSHACGATSRVGSRCASGAMRYDAVRCGAVRGGEGR